jgi:hypothetical protein
MQKDTENRVWLGTLISVATLSLQALALQNYLTAILTALTGSLVALIFYVTLRISQSQHSKPPKAHPRQRGSSSQGNRKHKR